MKSVHLTFSFLQAQLDLPHFDTPWDRDLDALEHVHHCQRGKKKKSKVNLHIPVER